MTSMSAIRRRRRSKSASTPVTTRRRRRGSNIVPGLIGTILTMTMLIFTALSVTREIERGTMENLLAMPITPVEIMLGKIVPYVLVGFVQAILSSASACSCSGCRYAAAWPMLAALERPVHHRQSGDRLHLFDHRHRTSCRRCRCRSCFSCRASCCPASCFRSPACRSGRNDRRGLPLTHYLRIVRAIMLKGATLHNLEYDSIALLALMLAAMTIAVTRFRRTLD